MINALRRRLRVALGEALWSKVLRASLLPTLSIAVLLSSAESTLGQAPAWQATRPADATSYNGPARLHAPEARVLPSSGNNATQFSTGSNNDSGGSELGGGVVLRWKRSASASQPTSPVVQTSATEAFAPQAVQPVVESSGNPLRTMAAWENRGRSSQDVQPAGYNQFGDVFQDNPGPPLPQLGAGPALEQQLPPNPISGGQVEQVPALQLDDPMDAAEEAPAPNGFDRRPTPPTGDDPSRYDEQFGDAPEQIRPLRNEDSILQLPDRDNRTSNDISCNELREQLRAKPLSAVDLNPSPKFGRGRALDYSDADEARETYASRWAVREWFDYTGARIGTGRLVDFRNNMVLIEHDGIERTIPYLDLSDADVAFVSENWNIPGRCGTGYEAFVGRDFIPTQFQWTANGACHKPGYFEDPQLERYGHTAGPVLQPLLSSAQFVGNLAILPYKMGIHPPNECQYSLGFIRPGNCAPYMIQPFPWSLRGAAVQAGAVTGAAALLP